MEITITRFFKECAPRDYSASVAEIGADAGAVTWGHAIEDSPEYLVLDTDDKREAFRDFVRSSGGWSDEEIARWSDVELNALCLQWIAGDIREDGIDTANPEWEKHQSDNNNTGRIYPGDDGEIYFYVGS